MLDSVLAGQCCVHARAIARIPNGPNSIIIIVSNLGQELCFQNASVAYGEARNQTASIDQGHLEAICVAMQQCEVRGRVTAYACRIDHVLGGCHKGDPTGTVCIGTVCGGRTAGVFLRLLGRFGLYQAIPRMLHGRVC